MVLFGLGRLADRMSSTLQKKNLVPKTMKEQGNTYLQKLDDNVYIVSIIFF